MTAGVFALMTMQNEFSTARMREVWDDQHRLEKMCQVEAALAKVQGAMGIIPEEAAREIQAKVRVDQIELRRLYLESARAGHFTSGFVKYFCAGLSKEAGQYIHYGLTTQDVLDTGVVLQLKEAHYIILEHLEQIIKRLLIQAKSYQETVIVGRAHGQHAAPTTLGFKLAVVVDELARYHQRLMAIEDFVFTASMSGVVGTQASFGDQAEAVESAFAKELGLSQARICWHTQRDRFIEYGHVLAMIAGCLGKLGQDLYDLSRSEIGEFSETYQKGRQGSTTIPTLRPPYMCEAVINLGQLIGQNMSLMYQSSRLTHEKDTIAWRNQWVVLPEMCLYLSAQLNYVQALLKFGHFDLEKMEANLSVKGGELLSERIMFKLGDKIGKEAAHEVLYQIINQAREANLSFEGTLRADTRIQALVSSQELDQLLDPHTYIGTAVAKTQAVIQALEALYD
ncbi:class-II fumarase/aspartase family protein [Facklamia hominis]